MFQFSIILVFLLLFISYYQIYFKKKLYCYKIKNKDIPRLEISEYNHVYTPLESFSSLFRKEIDVAHNFDTVDLEIKNNGMKEEFYIDVYNDKKERIYHFFSPDYLVFSTDNYGYRLEKNKKYSFFLITTKDENFVSFRYFKRNETNDISLHNDLIYLDESKEIEKFYHFLYRFRDIFYKKGYKNIVMKEAKYFSDWPNSGIYQMLDMEVPENYKLLIMTTNKNRYKIFQNIEINTENDCVLYPIEGYDDFWYIIIDNDYNRNIKIYERIYNITSSSNIIPLHILIIF